MPSSESRHGPTRLRLRSTIADGQLCQRQLITAAATGPRTRITRWIPVRVAPVGVGLGIPVIRLVTVLMDVGLVTVLMGVGLIIDLRRRAIPVVAVPVASRVGGTRKRDRGECNGGRGAQ